MSIAVTPPNAGSQPAAGDVVPWTWTVTNTGNVTLVDITPTGATCTAVTLTVGSNVACTHNHTLTQPEIDAGQLTRRIDVTANSTGGPASGFDETTVPLARVPGLKVTAAASLNSGNITVTYTVANTGNTTLPAIGVTLTDSTVLACTITSNQRRIHLHVRRGLVSHCCRRRHLGRCR
ncbi:conserved repeat domain-containing protein [Actinokineospora globicatena]|nr:conserved repeat domain-containing protein [Actinokineospora globicatena]